MSIISIETEDAGKRSIGKSIDIGAETLVFDILQKTQYSRPIDSSAKEVICNSIDALKEKEVAKLILTGKASVEDYYLTRDGEQYKDSNFNKDYYDLNWFDDKDEVVIDYIYSDGVGFCDKFIVKDTGVGLSPNRLYSLFSLGYSSKRNTNKGALGGFGLGAKSPLATGIDYFIIETCYNGMRLVAHCYNHKTDMVIGKYNENGEENPIFTFTNKKEEEVSFYYEKTDKKNNTIITIPTKRINRDKFINAVKSQILYFDKVRFYVIHEDGYKDEINFKAKVLYNSNNIIISDNNYYSKPHILIVKDPESSEAVSLGYIDFREMEMQELFSSVGIKCQIRSTIRNENGEEEVLQDGISISPNRENIIWDDHTRNYIINKFDNVQQEASELITDRLKEQDLLVWIEKATSALGNVGNDPILFRLSKIIDKASINPTFSADKRITFKHNPNIFFDGFNVRTVHKVYDYQTGKHKLERVDSNKWLESVDNVYYKEGETSREKDFYLLADIESRGEANSFMIIEPMELDKFLESIKVVIPDKDKSLLSEDQLKALKKKAEDERLDKRNLLYQYLIKSSKFKKYEDVVVPEDWKSKFDKDETIAIEVVKPKQLTPAEIRKLNEKTVCYRAVEIDNHSIKSKVAWKKSEPSIGSLNITGNIYYGTVDDEENLKKAFWISNNQASSQPRFYKVAAGNLKHYKKQRKISNFFKEITSDNIITMAPELINWYTAKLISQKIHKFKFLYNYKLFSPDLTKAYECLSLFASQYNTFGHNSIVEGTADNKEIEKNITELCDKILTLQLFTKDHLDEEQVKEKAAELFGLDSIKDGKAVLNEYYDLLLKVEEYCEPLYPLFNEINFLVNNAHITNEQEHLIKEIIELKYLQDYKIENPLLNPVIVPDVVVAEPVEEEVLDEQEEEAF